MATPTPGTLTVPAGTPVVNGGRSAPHAVAAGTRYRYQQSTLFQRAPVVEYPSRLPGGLPYPMERFGPTRTAIAPNSGWFWRNVGGDWIDAQGTPQGSVPWASTPINAVSGPAAAATYVCNVTSLVRHAQTSARHVAMLLRSSNAARAIASTNTATPPVLRITYVGGSTATLACNVAAAMTAGSSYPVTMAPDLPLPVVMDFPQPSEVVESAELEIRVTQHWSGSATLQIMLLDPQGNSDATQLGIADGAVLDAGLVGHPSIIGVHRVLPGTTLDDFCARAGEIRQPNFNALTAFDPAVYGTGPQDLTLLPHVSPSRWVGPREGWSIVDASYAAEGYEPLSAGVNAIRLFRPIEVTTEGSVVGMATSNPVNCKIYMPPDKFGTLDEIYVRYYVRIGTADGGPLINSNATRLQVYTSEQAKTEQRPVWTDCAGKFGIMPAHDCTDGGVTGTSGGGKGWQIRAGWYEVDLPDGPCAGGWGHSPHLHDFQANNPPGHRYGSPGGSSLATRDFNYGQRGGLGGMLYAHRWYCIETRLKLNSVDQPATLADGSPHLIGGVQQYWSPNGELQLWVDGRLAYSVTGLVMRSLPLQVNAAAVANTPSIYLPAVGNLGIRDLWLNIFHGGLTKRARPQIVFMTGLAWGTQYIGPMKLS